MKFVCWDTGNNKLAVFMDIGKLKFPIPEQITTQTGVEYLDTDTKKEEYYESQIHPYRFFNVDTYTALTKPDPENWGIVFKNVNDFLYGLTDKEHMAIAMTYIAMHKLINKMTSSNMFDTTDKISNYLSMLDKEIDLIPKLMTFTEKYMPLPNLDNAGERPHDTDEMTFRRPHMMELTNIALLCKLLTPIFGQFFWQYKNSISVDNSIKEIHCLAMLRQVFEYRHKPLVLKLNNFIRNTVLQQYKKRDDITSAIGGNTIESQTLASEATIYTRKLITVDLSKPGGNLMTYTTVCINNSVETQYKSPMNKRIKERSANSLKDITADEGNASRMETESIATAKTADVPVIARWTAKHIVQLYRGALEISDEMFDSAMAYYRLNLPPMTPLSNYLLCTYFGRVMGGALNISMLNAIAYAELSVILQFIMIRRGYYGLAHAMSMMPLNQKKPFLSDMDNRVRMSWNSSHSFSNLKRRFTIDSGSLQCSAKMKDIVEFLTTYIHSYNTAPVFWDLIGSDNTNSYQFECTADIMDTVCEFITMAIDTQYNT